MIYRTYFPLYEIYHKGKYVRCIVSQKKIQNYEYIGLLINVIYNNVSTAIFTIKSDGFSQI